MNSIVERKSEGRKPDKSQKLEFKKPRLKMSFKNSISAVYTKEFSKGRLKSFLSSTF